MNYECPEMAFGWYSSSRYLSSSSVSPLPLAEMASSNLWTLLKPIMGLVMRLLIHASATCEI